MSNAGAVTTHRYERWSGTLRSGQWTWLAIVANGLRLGYKRQEMRLFLMAAAGFVAAPCMIFYGISFVEIIGNTDQARGVVEFLRSLLGVDLSAVTKLSDIRELLWRLTFLFAIKAELILVLLVSATVGPGLIADDLKTRALPIYFARPVRPWNYVLGKGLIVALFIGAVSLVPNLLALVMGTLITGGLETWSETLRLGLRVFLAGVGLMILGGTLLPALSSMGSDKRFVTFGWLALCLLPMAAQKILTESLPPEKTTGFLGSLALNRDIAILTEWLFDVRRSLESTPLPPEAFEAALGPAVKPIYPAIALGSLVILSVLICHRRVVKFSRAAANV